MTRQQPRKAKRADRPRGGPSRPDVARGSTGQPAAEPTNEPAPDETRLAETDAELEAEVEAAADELRESGVAHRIASGERQAAQAPPAADVTTAREPARTASGRAVTPGGTAAQLPYVDDRFSKVWVALIAIVFAGLLANALLAGQGGYLTRTPSPSPSPSAAASPTGSPAATTPPSATPAASPS